MKDLLSPLLNVEPALVLIALFIAAIIVLIGYLIIVRSVMIILNSKIVQSPEVDQVPNKFGIYFLCAAFWPAALIVGNNYLAKPETARTGRMCIIIFLWFSGFVVLLSIATVYYSYIYLPEIISFLDKYGLW